MKAQYGLIGYPLGHSFSRSFFTKKFQEEKIDAEYLNFEIPEVSTLLRIIQEHPHLKGVNVTLPHKVAVIPLLHELSPEAAAIGAVNVIRITHTPTGGTYIKGFNRDVIGITDSIRPLLKSYHRKALVLGTGGASKAICRGLENLGIEWTYVSRNSGPDRLTYSQLTPMILKEYTVIVNCSPVGMYPKVDQCPSLPYECLTASHLLYDIVYNPTTTLFMKRGAEQGATVKNGIELLERQAIASWEFWNAK